MPDTTFPGAKEALEQLRPALLALPATEIGPYRFNAAQAVSNLFKVAGAFTEDRPFFEATFKVAAFNPAAFADLGVRAKAVWQADVEWRQRVETDKKLPGLVTEAGPLKKKLLRAAAYLWGEDPEAGPHVAAIRSGQGHLDLADDLIALANLFDARRGEADGKTHVTEGDLARARTLGAAIAAAYGGRDDDDEAEALRDLRQRAFHYAHTAAEEIRAAAAYVHRRQPERLRDYPSAFFQPSAPRPDARTDDAGAPTPAPAPVVEPVDA